MRCGLIGEGSSDRCLIPILEWLLSGLTDADLVVRWIDTSRAHTDGTLRQKVEVALRLDSSDLLFVHRDADGTGGGPRYAEIGAAAGSHPHVPVVPVRMSEAWLLLDEAAIRAAAGSPRGRAALALPPPGRVEALADPKTTLHAAIIAASGLTGRRRDKLDVSAAVHRVAALTTDWAPLRALPAFRRLEQDTRAALAGLGAQLRPDDP